MRRPKPTTTQRGYGAVHQTVRKRFAPKVEAGQCICPRCHKQILPGEPWDLGHIDGSSTEYAGPEHRACNRATAAHGTNDARPAPWYSPDGRPASEAWGDDYLSREEWLALSEEERRYRRRETSRVW